MTFETRQPTLKNKMLRFINRKRNEYRRYLKCKLLLPNFTFIYRSLRLRHRHVCQEATGILFSVTVCVMPTVNDKNKIFVECSRQKILKRQSNLEKFNGNSLNNATGFHF